MSENERLLALLGGFLNSAPAAVTAEMVESVTACGVSEEDAYALLLSGFLGLDASGADRDFFARWLRPCVSMLDTGRYRADDYARCIRVPALRYHAWELRQGRYAPYEAFVCGDYRLLPDGRVLPQIGFFPEPFCYPAALENGREWMTVTPNEIETMRAPIARAHGRTLVFGLGLGYFAYMVSQKPDVSHITVIEREPAIISLFQKHILPQFENADKLRIVEADAFEYAEKALRYEVFDFAFVDLWHDVSDGLPMMRRMRPLLEKHPSMETTYWIEDTMRFYE